jgi:hypothetical protein
MICRLRASEASLNTHSELTAARDQTTITHLAPCSAASMTRLKLLPRGMSRSHHTSRPCPSSALTSGSMRGRSAAA